MITQLDTQSWSPVLLSGNADFVRDPSGTLWVVSNVRPQTNDFIIRMSNPVPPDPGPGFTFVTVASYSFGATQNISFDPVVTYDATGLNPLLHIIGTQNNVTDPRLVDLVKFTYDTITTLLTGPVLLITGSDIREAYDLVLLNNAVTGGGINHKLIAVGVDNAQAPPLFVSSIAAVNIISNVLTVQASNAYAPGQLITLTGLTNASFLNNKQVNVATSSGSQFTAVYSHADYGGGVITSVEITANTLTITGNNTLTAGQAVVLSGLTAATFLNGQTVTVGIASSTQFTATFVHGNYGPLSDTGLSSRADTGSITPNFTGESLIAFELDNNDAVAGTIQVLATSPMRSGNTVSSVSLISPDGVNVETYWESHPKIVNFKDQFFTIFETDRKQATVLNEAHTIPVSPFQITVTNSAQWQSDIGVIFTAGSIPLTNVSPANPVSTGQYKVAAGLYTFFSGDVGKAVQISYRENFTAWDNAPTQLTQFQGRYTDSRLTATLDANGNRYLSQNYYTQTNHPEGLTGNLILGLARSGTISDVQIVSNTLTAQTIESFQIGSAVTLTGMGTSFLNGQTVVVESSSTTEFTAILQHPNYGGGAITNIQINSNTLTVTATNSLIVGDGVVLSGLTTATFLNGQTVIVASLIGIGPYSGFTATFAHADYPSASDTGLVTVPGYVSQLGGKSWFFHITLGSAVNGSIVQSSISVAVNGSVNLTYLLQPFEQAPPPPGLAPAYQFHVGSVNVANLSVTDVPGFYNTLNFTWLRGSKSTIDNSSLWAAVGERQVLATANETVLVPAVAPYVLQITNSSTFWQNTSVVDNSAVAPRTFTQVGEFPAEGQYTVQNKGIYEFGAADASVGITGISLVGDVLTVSGTNVRNLSIGMTVLFTGLTNSPYLNNQTVQVNQISVANGTFGGSFVHADDPEHADTGLAGRPLVITYTYISQIVPVYVSLFNVPPVAVLVPNTLTTVYRAQPLQLDASGSGDADQDPLEFIFSENDSDLNKIHLNASGPIATLTVDKTVGGNQQAHITNVALTTNVATLTAVNTFAPGQIVLFKNLVGATFLNGQVLAIQSATGTTFTVNFTHADYISAPDNGDAGVFRNFNVGVSVIDLFPDNVTPRHPADPITAIHVTSSTTAVITAVNTLGTGQQAMAYNVTLAPPAAPTFAAPVLSGVSANPITNIDLTSNLLTVLATNNLVAGQGVTFSGVTTSTYLNTQTVTVISATATQFTANFTHADDPTHADTGQADFPPALTYFVKTTYVNAIGESLASAEGSTSVAAGSLPVVNSPSASGDATSYNVYMSLTTGTEGLQTGTAPITLGTTFPLSRSGVLSGAPVPTNSTAILEVISDQALTVTSATGSTANVTGAFASTTPITVVTGSLIPQFQFAITSIQVPFNAIPTITFPAPAWSPGPQVSVARNKLITITTGSISNPAIQFPVVITGVNDNDDATTYVWAQLAGTPVVFTTSVFHPNVSFETNGVDVHGEALVFQLTVSDGVNPSVSSTCTVNVAAYNFAGLDTLRLSRSVWNEVTDVQYVQVGPTALSLQNVLTIVAPNEFVAGLTITLTGLTAAVFLNNQSIIVTSAVNTSVVSTLTQVQRVGTLVTITSTNSFDPGQVVTVAAVTTVAVNGTFTVLSSTGTTFTYNTVASGNIGPVADTGTATLVPQFTGFFNHADYALTAETGDATSPARISQRNNNHVWGDLDISALFSNLSTIKRTSVLDGTDRYIVISPFTVVVYGGVNPNSVLLRKVFTPSHTNVADAVHTEDDATLLLDDNGSLYRYSTAPLINTDNPDTTINLSLLSSMNLTNIFCTSSFADVRVIALSGPDGCLLLQCANDTLQIQSTLELTLQSNLLFGANNVQFIRTAGVESVRTGKVLVGTVISAQATVTQVQVSSNALTLTCDNTFFLGDDIHLSGFTGPTAFLNGVRITVISQTPTAIVGSLQTADLAPTGASGLAVSDTDGTTYETLINLPHSQIIGTWDSSKLRNQYVNTGEILFEPDSTYSGHPIPPVQNPPTSRVTPNGPEVTISWTQERPDLVQSYAVESSQIIADNTTVPVSLQVQTLNATIFGQDLGVVDASGSATITQVQITTNVLTVTAVNHFTVGNQVSISGLSTATFLNGAVVTVLTASGTQFTANFTNANYGPQVDSGLATAQINQNLVLVPINIVPGPGQYSVNTGTYTFNAAQLGDSITINFSTNFQLLQNVNSGAVQKLVLIMPSGTYQFRIRAFSSDGISGYSNIESPISF